jgi:bla regulator protein BlaR1
MILENVSAIGTAMANHLWQSTLFALLAAVSTLALRKNQARIRHHIWLAASLKFLVPFALLVNIGSHLAKLNGATETAPVSTETAPVFYFVLQTMSHPFHQASNSLLRWLPAMVAILWLAGFVTVIGRWCLSWRRVAVTMRGAIPVAHGREVELLRRVEKTAGIRRPISLRSSQTSLEPGIFGIIRPLLLWPAGISERLKDAHLEAILAHEAQHVRRRDNLAAALHMVVEAIFWFHPLAWWLGARLVEERERACDEAVLLLGNPPEVYAESILKTCEFCVASPLACLSGVTGADLKQRIVRIVTQRSVDKLGFLKKLLLVAIGTGAVTIPIVGGLIKTPVAAAQSAQAPARTPGAFSKFAVPQELYHRGEQLYHVGGEVSAPKLIFAPDPEYSEKARQAKYQGVCVISLIIDEQGNPMRVQVVRHLGMGLDKKAVEAVKAYRFEPAMRFGKPVAVTVNIEVNFRLY